MGRGSVVWASLLIGVLAVSGCGSNDGSAESPRAESSASAAESTSATSGATVATRASASSAPSDDPPDPTGAVEFDAVVQVSKEKGERMVFRGVTLHRPENEMPVVVTYSPNPIWSDLDGLTVHVVATPYTPQGRAIMGDHMTVHRLSVVDEKSARTIAGFGPTKRVTGALRVERGAPGTKSEGEQQTYLDVGTTSYRVYQNDLRDDETPSGQVELLVRSVTLSRFATHEGGPHVWIVARATGKD
ncbi:MAG: hypothetical protein U0271_35540 [Polyangiaceae bacterium]